MADEQKKTARKSAHGSPDAKTMKAVNDADSVSVSDTNAKRRGHGAGHGRDAKDTSSTRVMSGKDAPGVSSSLLSIASSQSKSSIMEDELLEELNIAILCAIYNDVERFHQCFDDPADPYHDTITSLLNQRSIVDGKTALDYAALLGKQDMLQALIAKGVDVNSVNSKGYTALHLAVAWGQDQSARTLVASGANIQLKTDLCEQPRDIAQRYNQQPCVEYMHLVGTKQSLHDYFVSLKDSVVNAEKGKALTKDEKNTANALIAENVEWLEQHQDASLEELTAQRKELDTGLGPLLTKITEFTAVEKPCEKKLS